MRRPIPGMAPPGDAPLSTVYRPAFRGRISTHALLCLLLVLVSACKDDGPSDAIPPESGTSPPLLVQFSDQTPAPLAALSKARGVSLVDYNDDGLPDIGIAHRSGVTLLRQTADSWVQDPLPALDGANGLTWADVNDDGHLDLLVIRRSLPWETEKGRRANTLLLGDGQGGFSDGTEASGLTAMGFWECAAFGDIDNDGDLDLALSGGPTMDGSRAHLPEGERGAPNVVYRNQGNGLFEEDVDASCLGPETGEGWVVLLVDADLDGDLDLFWTNDFIADTYCRNRGDGTFEDVSAEVLGVQRITGAMGAAFGDLDGDACPEIYLTNLGSDLVHSAVNSQRFERAGHDLIDVLTDTSSARSGWGVGLLDADLDGDQDVITVSGHHELEPSGMVLGGMSYYHNEDGRLSDEGWAANDLFTESVSGYGLATGDIDRDGDLDVLVGLYEEEPVLAKTGPLLLFNDTNRADHNALSIQLRQAPPNARAIGATVIVQANGKRTLRSLTAGSSYLSAHEQRLHFGLGTATKADWVTVIWPGGHQQIFTNVPSGPQTLERSTATCVPEESCEGIQPVGPCIGYSKPELDPALCAPMCEAAQACNWLDELGWADAASCEADCSTHQLAESVGLCLIETPCEEDAIAKCCGPNDSSNCGDL